MTSVFPLHHDNMPLTLSLQHDITTTLDLRPVDPIALREMSPDQIKGLTLWQGNRQVKLGELFTVTGSAGDAEVRLAGDLRQADNLGAGLSGGKLLASGNVGNHAGQSMTGGRLEISGDAGDRLAEDLQGGSVLVRGNAGDKVGTPLPGSKLGMRGGTVCIHGNVGQEAGHRMRRGLLIVGGNTGPLPGHEILAGTIALLGRIGNHPGLRMKRGTMLCPRLDPSSLSATFHHDGRFPLPMLPQLLDWIASFGFPEVAALKHHPCDQFSGDSIHYQRGEILVPCAK